MPVKRRKSKSRNLRFSDETLELFRRGMAERDGLQTEDEERRFNIDVRNEVRRQLRLPFWHLNPIDVREDRPPHRGAQCRNESIPRGIELYEQLKAAIASE